MRVTIREKKKFDGQTFSRTLSYHNKREAQEAALNNRKAGYMARVTSTKTPNGMLYHVWIHYPLLRKLGGKRR